MSENNIPEKFEAPMVKVSQATVETVKRTIFKGASDAELQLFFHKCLSVGCHPLDQLIFPVKFKDHKDGGFTLTFISSIDLMRAKAEETEEYDGQDEPEFTMGEHDDTFPHPTKATVNVYRKGIDRPFVGVANWSEFFPSDEKKQFFWKKMPHVQIGKCAEAQGLRKAFPKKLNKLYAEEEMHQAIEAAAKTKSTKPQITQPTLPAGESFELGIVESVTVKSGKKDGKPWTRYGAKISGATYGTFDKEIGELAGTLKNVNFTWKKDGKFKTLLSIMAQADQEPEPIEPEVTEKETETVTPKVEALPQEIFVAQVAEIAKRLDLKTADDIDKFLFEKSGRIHKSLSEVPADGKEQGTVLDLFTYWADKEEEK